MESYVLAVNIIHTEHWQVLLCIFNESTETTDSSVACQLRVLN